MYELVPEMSDAEAELYLLKDLDKKVIELTDKAIELISGLI